MYNNFILHTFTELTSEMKDISCGGSEELVRLTVAALMRSKIVAICNELSKDSPFSETWRVA
jgi:hypothetical protein